jgi:hypothetical protein
MALSRPSPPLNPGRFSGAGRESSRWTVKRFGSWGLFLAGDQSGDRGQDGVEVFASAEVS